VDRHDGRMVQSGRAAGLAQEPLQVFFAGETAGPGHLDRNDTVEFGIAGLVHSPEGPDSDDVDQLELAQLARAVLWALGRYRAALQAAGRSARGAEDLVFRFGIDALDRVVAVRAGHLDGWTLRNQPAQSSRSLRFRKKVICPRIDSILHSRSRFLRRVYVSLPDLDIFRSSSL
jgi:hypothetical protein